jgi:hypothetical protein
LTLAICINRAAGKQLPAAFPFAPKRLICGIEKRH